MNAREEAEALLAKDEELSSTERRRRAYKKLSPEAQTIYDELHKASFFVPKNAVAECRKEILSPSGKYKLVITPYRTTPGAWSYTQGLVYSVGSDTPIAEVQRNYSSFEHHWVEGHVTGHDLLVCGADYEGQTVIELDTGARKDVLSAGAEKGAGFCWVAYRYDAATQLLVVEGCIWACPFEFRFYDFSNPMAGWPELETEEFIEHDKKRPELRTDGTIRCFETPYEEDDDDEEENSPPKAKPPIQDRAIKTFKREGLKLVLVDEWVSDSEKERRRKQEEAQLRYEQEIADFKANDPLYLEHRKLLKEHEAALPAGYCVSEHASVGITHERWCPSFTLEERRWCHRIVERKRDEDGVLGSKGPCVDLEWATKTGPIKLVLYRNGSHVEDVFFEHSVECMNQAYVLAREFVSATLAQSEVGA